MSDICDLIDDLRDDLHDYGFGSSLSVKFIDDHTLKGFVSSLEVSNVRKQAKFKASGFSTVQEYVELLEKALLLIRNETLEDNNVYQVNSSSAYDNPIEKFSMGKDLGPVRYWVDALEALEAGWGFTDSVSNRSDSYRHVAFRRMKWGDHFSSTVFPALAKTAANFDVIIHSLKEKAFQAYQDHPNEVVYVDVNGNVRVDKHLTKAIMGDS